MRYPDQGYQFDAPHPSSDRRFLTVETMCGVFPAGTHKDLLTHSISLLTLTAACNSIKAHELAALHFPDALDEPTCEKCFNILVRLKEIKT